MHYAPDSDSGDFSRWEIGLATRLVIQALAGRQSLWGFDDEDLLQECLFHWSVQRSRYDMRRGASPATFMRRVIKAKLADICRRARATKRGGYTEPLSLDAAPDHEGRSLADRIADQARASDPEEAASLALLKSSIARVLPLLTARQRRVIQGLGSGLNVAEISRALGLRRSTLYDEIQRIRKVFREEGLAEFLR